jgi:hypothetical protein
VDARHAEVEPVEHLVGLVEAAVVEDVDLDALEQREASVQVLVDRVDDEELPPQPLDAQPVGHGQPRRVVGEHLVVVAQLHRGERHLLDRRAAVGPVRVRVQVAAEQGVQLAAALDQRTTVLGLQRGEPTGHLAPDRGRDHLGGAGADARDVGDGPGLDAGPDLLVTEGQDRRGGVAVGLDLVGLLAAPLEQEPDPAQRRDRPAVVRLRHDDHPRSPGRRTAEELALGNFRPQHVDGRSRRSEPETKAASTSCPQRVARSHGVSSTC